MAAATLAGATAASAHRRPVPAGFSTKVQDLVSQMTLDEKLSMVHGSQDPSDIGESGYVAGVPRLGIPSLRLADGSSGVRLDEPSVVMPAPIALASSFDDSLATSYGSAVGHESAALGADSVLTPMVNSIRIPYGGRNYETFSEDPLVSSRAAAAEVRGLASQGQIPVVKHLAANNQEDDRQTVNVNVDEQTLQQIELPPFQAAVKAGAGAVMCSYSNLNGPSSCANPDLLTDILRDQMQFKGWVMSDWRMALTADAMNQGLDQEMPAATYFGDELKAALTDGTVAQTELDRSVARILTEMEQYHLLGDAVPPRPARDLAGATATAQDVAEAGAVLLRNQNGTLPLSSGSGSVAVIGEPAAEPKLNGGGSSHVLPKQTPTAPLDAIRTRAGAGTSVTYAAGDDSVGVPLPENVLSPVLSPDAGLPAGQEGVFYNGEINAPAEGDYTINLKASGGGGFIQVDGAQSALFGDTITDGYTGLTVHLTAGAHTILLYGFADFVDPLRVDLRWTTPEAARTRIDEAVAAAKAADTAVVFVSDDLSEGLDRSGLSLPGHQDALVAAVAAANPRTVVVLNTGSAVKMPWLSRTAAVLDMWYPGQKGAEATAALLYGDVNPQGRLTQTFPADEDHTPVSGDPAAWPGTEGQVHYTEGIQTGYRWYQKNGVTPLFPFGYGLSYTSFSYSGLTAAATSDGGYDVKLTVRNTGSRAGSETPQVYLGASPDVSAPQATRALAGYTKVTLGAGQSRTVTIHVDAQQLKYWDTASHSWKKGTGKRTLQAGPSSATLPLSTTVQVS